MSTTPNPGPPAPSLLVETETHVVVVPAPSLRVDGLAHRSQHPQRAQVVVGDDVGPEAHERPDGRGRGVELGHLVPLDHVPVPVKKNKMSSTKKKNVGGM